MHSRANSSASFGFLGNTIGKYSCRAGRIRLELPKQSLKRFNLCDGFVEPQPFRRGHMNISRRPFTQAALLLVAALSVRLAAQSRTVKIGVQIPLTGERANVGKTMQSALQM